MPRCSIEQTLIVVPSLTYLGPFCFHVSCCRWLIKICLTFPLTFVFVSNLVRWLNLMVECKGCLDEWGGRVKGSWNRSRILYYGHFLPTLNSIVIDGFLNSDSTNYFVSFINLFVFVKLLHNLLDSSPQTPHQIKLVPQITSSQGEIQDQNIAVMFVTTKFFILFPKKQSFLPINVVLNFVIKFNVVACRL